MILVWYIFMKGVNEINYCEYILWFWLLNVKLLLFVWLKLNLEHQMNENTISHKNHFLIVLCCFCNFSFTSFFVLFAIISIFSGFSLIFLTYYPCHYFVVFAFFFEYLDVCMCIYVHIFLLDLHLYNLFLYLCFLGEEKGCYQFHLWLISFGLDYINFIYLIKVFYMLHYINLRS